jgi:hypothetical protein
MSQAAQDILRLLLLNIITIDQINDSQIKEEIKAELNK